MTAALACASDRPPENPHGTGTATTTSVPSTTTIASATAATPAPTAAAAAMLAPKLIPLPATDRTPKCPPGSEIACVDSRSVTAEKDSPVEQSCPVRIDEAGLPIKSPGGYLGFRPEETRIAAGPSSGSPKGTKESPHYCCYNFAYRCAGRLLLDECAAPVTAPLRAGASWLAAPFAVDAGTHGLPDPERAARAQHWLQDARMEHASVASFARTTLELMALGAPASLVRDTQRASLDEIEHTEVCFAIAAAYGAQATEPGPLPALPARAADVERFAFDTLVEGCIGETNAALEAAERARNVPSVLVAACTRIADDEARHSALAWRTLAWALQGRAALARKVYEHALTTRVEGSAIHAQAWSHIILPTLASLCGVVTV